MCGIWFFLSKLKNLDHELYAKCMDSFMKTKNRGPDRSHFEVLQEPINSMIGFHRLSIMDPGVKGDQPFKIINGDHTIFTICNGEIYNFRELEEKYNIKAMSGSDCEVIPHLYQKIGINNLVHELIGEYAFIIFDVNMITGDFNLYAVRDRFGIRPMFYAESENHFNFSSEMKSLVDIKEENITVNVLEPRRIYHIERKDGVISSISSTSYYEVSVKDNMIEDLDTACNLVKDTLIESVRSKLISDRPLGCLLSGGLDSSLIASIASKILKERGQKLRTFSIGMDGSTDEYYAKLVAKHIQSDHTHIELDQQEFIDNLRNVIYNIESFDITTVRASTGQYLVSKWISKNTDIKVLLIGDGSDELCAGYLYFHKAPSAIDSHNENIRLISDIHYYDVLRADRGIAENGIEARVPFLDHRFVDLYLTIKPELRIPTNNSEKWLLRRSFSKEANPENDYLPDEVLWRKKEAFSDGVSSKNKSWYQIIQEYAKDKYSDEDLTNANREHLKPVSKESLYFREIFEEYYGKNVSVSKTIPYFWLPKWMGNILEPSARVLSVYKE